MQGCECEFAWIEITNKCNLKCIHCYNESGENRDQTMSLNDYKGVIDNLQEMGVKKIQIIGGEPFFYRKLLKKMLDYTVGKFEIIEIFTNGTLITNDWYEYLLNENIRIALSIYSYLANEHNKVTQHQGAWEKTNDTISKLKMYGIKYRICNVLMKNINLGTKTTDLYTLNSNRDIVRMSGRASFDLLSDELIKKKLITKKSFQKPIRREFCKKMISGHNCFENKIYIASDLTVYPCVMERRLKHGKMSVGSKFKLDNEIRNLNKDRIDICNKCEYRYACFDCRPDSISGKILEKPWYCTYNPDEGKWEDEDEFILKLKSEWGTANESKKNAGYI